MSDPQAEALQALGRQAGLIAADPPGPEAGTGEARDLINGALPKVELPGEEILLSKFAREVGRIVAKDFLYRRESTVMMIDAARRRLQPVDADAFRSLVEQKLICYKTKVMREGVAYIAQTMPVETARGCLRAPEFLALLPEIERVNSVRLPVMRDPIAGELGPDGKPAPGKIELLPEGYDARTRTYTFPSGIVYDETMEASQGASNLEGLLSEFPFGDWPVHKEGETGPMKPSRSQAVVIAGLLTLFGAGLLPKRANRPAFIYTANSQRSGKTLLAEIGLIAVHGSAGKTNWPKPEEMEKLLHAAAQDGRVFILFDNARGHIGSTALEIFLTADEIEGRILGTKEYFRAPNLATVFITGNAATVNEDMHGRSLYVELFLQEANVQERSITREIDKDWLARPENRAMILSSLWALVRDWDAKGRPANARRLAGFESWARCIGGIVSCAGLGDCLEPVVLEQGGPKESEDVQELVLRLFESRASTADVPAFEFEFPRIVEIALEHGLFDWIIVDADLSQSQKSTLGKLLKRWACGRTFSYPAEDGGRLQLRFGNRGKHKGRKYLVTRI